MVAGQHPLTMAAVSTGQAAVAPTGSKTAFCLPSGAGLHAGLRDVGETDHREPAWIPMKEWSVEWSEFATS